MVSGDWGEAGSNASLNEGSGAQALEGDATWTYSFFESDSWSAAGGDFEQDASSTLVLGRSTGFYSWTGPGMIDDVRFWLQNSDKNFGWILKGDESVLKSTRRFDSHENASPDFHPKLKIQYAEPVSVQKNAQTGLFHAGAYPNPFMATETL